MTELEACVVLNMISGIGPVRISALLEFCGSAAAIFQTPEQDLRRIPGISAALASKIVHWEEETDLKRELKLAERGGVKLLIRSSEEYPSCLREIHDAPVCLYVRGTIPPEINQRSIAMVGTRNISHYGERMARFLAEAAAFSGWVVVSGLAVGIDTVVHRATVNAGGKTIAVLGGGLARLHPQENLPLAKDIIAGGGAVISEFPMTFSPTRHTFPVRNRIISGLSQGTIVIEAGINSGSLITAAHAVEQGRRLFAVPGNVDTNSACGCNALIRNGAVLTENFDHVLEEFDFLPGFDSIGHGGLLREDSAVPGDQPAGLSFPDTDAGEEEEDGIGLGPAAVAVLSSLSKGDRSIDALSVETGLSAQEILSATIALEIVTRVRRNPDGTFRKVR